MYHCKSPGTVAEGSPLYLVAEPGVTPKQLETLLGPEMELRLMTPGQILRQTAHERERMLTGASAALIDWNDESAGVMLALRDFAHRKTIPLVALCGQNEAEHVAALVMGADDTITRPLRPTLLKARLMAYQRLVDRIAKGTEETGDGDSGASRPEIIPLLPGTHEICTAGPLALDRTARRFYVYGHPEALTPRAFDLMAFLMLDAGACQTRDEILNRVWGIDFETETNILDVQIYALRRTLKAHGLEFMIETVRGVGYRLVHR